MDPTPSNPMTEAINRLWEKHLPQILERVATLQRAAETNFIGTLSPEQQQNAASDAHKLAGVLGTFGLRDATELAREAEAIYESPSEHSPATTARLAAIAAALKSAVVNRSRQS